jgi:MoaA/NifB/PqqE/SkfB family radical SAM enzyme
VKVGFSEITLITNGVKLGDARYVKSLVAAGVTNVRMSLHAADAETHDKIVAVPGAFEKALNGVEHLRKHGVPVGLNYVLVKENVLKLPDFVRRFLVDGDFEDLIVYFPHERGMMALNAAKIGITYEQARSPLLLAAKMLDAAAKRGSMLIANIPPCAAPELKDMLLDWEKEPVFAASGMMGPEGGRTDLNAMKDAQRQEIKACRRCSVQSSCRGVEPEYVVRHGETEFEALR